MQQIHLSKKKLDINIERSPNIKPDLQFPIL